MNDLLKDLKPSEKILKIIFLITTITSIIITFFSRLSIPDYVRFCTIPLLIIITAYTILAEFLEVKLNRKAYIYLAYILLIVISNFIVPLAEVNRYLNIVLVPILTSIYIFSLINPNYKINLNIFKWFFNFFPNYLFSNTEYIEEAVKTTKVNNNKTKEILIGIGIAVPLLIVLILLLTSADQYFSAFMSNIGSLFKFDFKLDNIFETVITLVISFIIIFSTSVNIYNMRNIKDSQNNEITVSDTISYIILTFVNLAYLLFLISEISKLTTNFLNIPVEYTYAKYAREGFFQLLGVSTINFAILLFYQNFAKSSKENKWIKCMLLTIICFSIFIIFNSYYRMGLYIFEYGFTILRLQVILFLTMELIFFVILVFKLNKKQTKNNNLKYLIIMLVTYFLNIYLCNELVINFINTLWFKYVIK